MPLWILEISNYCSSKYTWRKVKMENEKKAAAWEEYTNKANNFCDWYTAIIISNFAFLVSLLDNEHTIQSILERDAYLWNLSFYSSCAALFFIFIAKGLGVMAASMRVDKIECEKFCEDARTAILIIFGFLGIFSLFFTVCILNKMYEFGN